MKKNSAYWNRLIHRDVAYFFLGLIIAFSISGIALNHRENFNPQEYIVKTEALSLSLPKDHNQITDTYLKEILKPVINDEYRGSRLTGNELRLYFKNAFAFVNKNTGKGEIEYVKTIPVLGQMTILHKTTNTWWIWFSDIFGIAMLVIAITGMFISRGKYSFKKRRWVLAVLGLIFPFIFLFLIH